MTLLWLCAVLLALPGAWGECGQPPRFAFAEPPVPLEPPYAVGATLRYSCRPGYTMARGKSAVVTCGPNSLWSWDPDFCIGKSCGPPDIMNGKFDYTTDLLFGAMITFTCNSGYRLVGASSAQCVLDGNEVSWSSIPHCDIIPCLPPPEIKNGQLTDGDRDFTFGMVVTYRCNQGFSLIGNETIHCTTNDNLNGIWSSPAPECKVVKCKNPEVKNGKRLSGFGTEHTYKNTVVFECNPGHVLNGSNIVTCEADSTWKPPLPTCDPVCGPAPHFSFAELTSIVGDSSLAGTELRYQCKPGYDTASGKSSVVTCLSNGTWSAEPDFCIRQQCTHLTLANGAVIAANFLFETVVTFICEPGYELKGSSSAKCVVSGNGVDWDTAPPRCEIRSTTHPPLPTFPSILCEEPPTIDNGMHNGTKGTRFVHGSVVVYECKDGFTLAGPASIHCKADQQYPGVWSKPTPECRGDLPPVPSLAASSLSPLLPTFPSILCEEPPTIDNGMHNGTKGTRFVHGSVVVYKCKDGFTLAGPASVHCKADQQYPGVWSKPTPECRGGANMIIAGIFPLLLAMLIMNL